MEYKRDLLKNNDKSIFRLILGIAFCVISILWIVARLAENDLIRPFDWFYSGIFALNGVTHIFTGLGTSVERFLGNAFVHIDSEMIEIKLGVFAKEQKIDWQEIKLIEYQPANFTIQKLDNSYTTISISKLDYSSIIGIKDILSKLADSKDIRYNIQ